MSGTAAILVGLALPAVAGWGVVGLLDRANLRSPAEVAGRLALALLAGLGLSSVLAFGMLMAGGALGTPYVLLDAAVFAALAAAAGWAGRRQAVSLCSPAAITRADLAAGAVLLVAVVFSAWAFVKVTEAAPHGEWDAFAIWNLRARFLLRAGSEWRRGFAPELGWSHVEYPLLVPLSVARLWAYAGETQLAPAIVAATFTFAAPVALGTAVSRVAGNLTGTVAALLLLGTAGFTLGGAMQFADVPVAAFLVAGAGALLGADDVEAGSRRARLALAGFLLGLGGWTKNEGLAAASCVVAAHVALRWRARGTAAFRDLAPIAIGAALPAAAWLFFHGALVRGVAADLVPDGGGGRRLLDPGRWWFVLSYLESVFPGREHDVPVFALVLAVALGARPRTLLRSTAVVASVLLLCVEVLVYVVTPKDLAWHLGTSASRVLLQAWPLLLLGLFSAAKPPAPRGRDLA